MASRKVRGHRCIDPVAAERLAGLLPVMLMELITLIQWDLAVIDVTDRSSAARIGRTGRCPGAAPRLRGAPRERPGARARAVVDKSLLVPLELLPGDVTGMVVVHDERPVLGADPARPAFDPRLLAGQEAMRVLVRP